MPTASNSNELHYRVRYFAYAALVVFAGLCSMLFCCYDLCSQSCAAEQLESGVNPNIAGMDSLVRLPGIGPSRAGAIIDYRNQVDGVAFENAGDLQKIKGIGPKTVEKIGDYLYFTDENQGNKE